VSGAAAKTASNRQALCLQTEKKAKSLKPSKAAAKPTGHWAGRTPVAGCSDVGGNTGAGQIMYCHRNGAGDMACCVSDNGCFVYVHI
jgi:hypothetical protein